MKAIFLLIIFTLIFAGCNSKTKPARKPVTNIQISPSNEQITYGKEFTITILSRVIDPEIKNIDLYINNKLVKSSTEHAFTIQFDSKDLLPGNHRIKVVAENVDGKKGTNYANLLLVSDIKPEELSYKIIDTYPHDVKNFTQGFEFYKDLLYEGTGNYGETYIYAYNPVNQNIVKSKKINNRYFGEGITILNDKLYQLTYKARKCFVYNIEDLSLLKEFTFSSKEGWGLTNNGEHLIMSDGTDQLTFIDPETFEIIKKIYVSTPNGTISNINELEYVDGSIYANIWTSLSIVKIEAQTGRVLALANMNSLLQNVSIRNIDVMNGIAYRKSEDAFYLTGKYWPNIFKVQFYSN